MKPGLQRGLRVALAVVALLVLAVLGVWSFVQTKAGGRVVQRIVLRVLEPVFPGRFSADSVDLDGNRVFIRGLKLWTPDGLLVGEAAEVQARADLAALLRGHILLTEGRVQSLRLRLVNDPRGLNLVLALTEPEDPNKPKVKTRGPKVVVDVRDAVLEDAAAELVLHEETQDRRYALSGMMIRGDFRFDAASKEMRLDVRGNGQATEPVSGPVTAHYRLTGGESFIDWNVVARGPGVDIDGGMRHVTDQPFEATVRRLHATAEAAQALLSEYELQAPIEGTGTLRTEAGQLSRFEAKGLLGSASVQTEGQLLLEQSHLPSLQVKLQRLDPAELFPKAPHALLDGAFEAKDLRWADEGWSGQIHLDVPRAVIEGQAVGPIRARGALTKEALQLEELEAVLPGVELRGSGQGTQDALDVKGRLVVTDLAKLGRAWGVLRGEAPPVLSGRGVLHLAASGSLRHPALAGRGQFTNLSLGAVRAQGVTARLKMPDVRRPFEAEGIFEAARLVVANREFKALRATLATRGRVLDANVGLQGVEDVTLHLLGTVAPGGNEVALSEAELRWPDNRWLLAEPTTLSFEKGFTLGPTTLTSNGQKVHGELAANGQVLRASLSVEALDLSRLPRSLAPDLALGGILDGALTVNGKSGAPQATARLSWKDGRLGALTQLSVEGQGTYEQDRAKGELHLRQAPANLDLHSRFDLPVTAMLRGREGQVAGSVTLQPLELAQAWAMLGRPSPASGKISGKLELWGSAADPHLKVSMDGRGLRWRNRPPPPQGGVDGTFLLESGQDSKLGARVDWKGLGAQGFAVLRSAFTAGAVLRKPPSASELARALLEGELEAREVPLAPFFPKEDLELHGKADLRGTFQGSLHDPGGQVTAQLSGVRWGRLAKMDARLLVTAKERQLKAVLSATREGQSVASGTFDIRLPPEDVWNAAAMATVPMTAELKLGAFSLSELQRLWTDPERLFRPLSGAVVGQLRLGGTLQDPVIQAQAQLEQIALTDRAVGGAVARLDYAGGRSQLTATLTSSIGGALRLEGRLLRPFGLYQKGPVLPLDRAPVSATLRADRFDVAFLNGLVPQVRALGGTLQGNASVEGFLMAPKLRGRLEWQNGRLAVPGYGDYRRIQILIEGDSDHLRLVHFTTASGGGELTAEAKAIREQARYRLSGNMLLTRFPVVMDDQLLATASARASFQGEASAELVSLTPLTVTSATLELPDVRRKDLQALERPNDIQVMKDGKPVYRPRQPKDKSAPMLARTDSTREYRVVFQAPRNLWVRSNDVNAELGLSEGFRVTLTDELAVSGEVRVLRGRVEVVGRRFDVQRDSTVRFTGPPRLPTVNLTAVHLNERESITVFMTVRGQGTNLELRARSEPPLSESEIYALLATGRRQPEQGASSSLSGSQAAVSVIGAVATTELQKAFNRLPLLLSVEPGTEGISDLRFRAGAYVSDRVYVGYSGQLGADRTRGQNSNAVRLEYQFTPRWSVQAEYGDAYSGGLDLVWSRDY